MPSTGRTSEQRGFEFAGGCRGCGGAEVAAAEAAEAAEAAGRGCRGCGGEAAAAAARLHRRLRRLQLRCRSRADLPPIRPTVLVLRDAQVVRWIRPAHRRHRVSSASRESQRASRADGAGFRDADPKTPCAQWRSDWPPEHRALRRRYKRTGDACGPHDRRSPEQLTQHNSKEVPQFAPNFTVYVLPPDVVCLYSEDRKFFLHGELYYALASAIGEVERAFGSSFAS